MSPPPLFLEASWRPERPSQGMTRNKSSIGLGRICRRRLRLLGLGVARLVLRGGEVAQNGLGLGIGRPQPGWSNAVESASALWRRLARAPEAVAGHPVAGPHSGSAELPGAARRRPEEAQGASWGTMLPGDDEVTMPRHAVACSRLDVARQHGLGVVGVLERQLAPPRARLWIHQYDFRYITVTLPLHYRYITATLPS